MKNLARPLCGISLILAAAFQTVLAQPAQVERPALKPGSEWTYKIDNSQRDKPGQSGQFKRVVKEAGANEYTLDLVAASGTRSGAMTLDLNPFSEGMTTGNTRASGALPYFSFPLAPGKTYSGSLTYPSPFNGAPIKVDMSTRVLDWEEVTVPAGKFRALKIEATGKSSGTGISGARNATLWYASEVGHFVRMEFVLGYSPFSGKQIQELTSYTLK